MESFGYEGLIPLENLSDYGLFLAAQEDNLFETQRYISGGWNLDIKDGDGVNVLMYAAFHNSHDVLSLLLEEGVSVCDTDNCGNTVLMYAVFSRSIDALRILLENKIDPNIENQNGDTALDFAVSLDNRDIINLLTEYGAGMVYNNGFIPPSLFLYNLKIQEMKTLVLNIITKEEFKTSIPEYANHDIAQYLSLGKYPDRRDALIVERFMKNGYTQNDALNLVKFCNRKLDDFTVCR